MNTVIVMNFMARPYRRVYKYSCLQYTCLYAYVYFRANYVSVQTLPNCLARSINTRVMFYSCTDSVNVKVTP